MTHLFVAALDRTLAETDSSRHNRRSFRGPKWDPDILIHGQVVPEDFAGALRTLHAVGDLRLDAALRLAIDEGWTGQALATALGLTRGRVLQRAAVAVGDAPGVDIPPPPRRVVAPKPKPAPPRRLPAEEIARLKAFQAVAKTVNGSTLVDDPRRALSVRFTQLLAQHVEDGFSIPYLAKVLGVRHQTVYFRLGRHGYRKLPPSLADNRYKGEPNSWVKKDRCPAGHEMGDDNVYVRPNGSRYCRTCQRRRSLESYHRRKNAEATS